MSTKQEYFIFIQEQLSGLSGVSFRKMMGEYIIYYEGKVIGGIYDNRLLVKPTNSAKAMMPNAAYELPYPNAKEMLPVDEADNPDFLKRLIAAVADDLPEARKR